MKREHSAIRQKIESLLERDIDIEGYLIQMLEKAPNNLVETLYQQPLDNPVYWEVVLKIIRELERYTKPEKLYFYLAEQASLPKRKLLESAIKFHEDSSWLVALSKDIEGDDFGKMHIMEKKKSKNLPQWIFSYAVGGSRKGLVGFAQETGNPLPAAALFRVNAYEDGMDAAVGALRKNPKSPVLKYIVAAIGPDIEHIVEELFDAFEGELPICLENL
jgi:hypothetical protein